jgi:hypothetical protein
MKEITEDLYQKIQNTSREVQAELRKKGLVVPVKLPKGYIKIGDFTIVKNRAGWYNIVDAWGEIIVKQINLPQTAAMLANGLALGKMIDSELVAVDRNYGYALFEETLYNRNTKLNKTIDHYHISTTKFNIARIKKEQYKSEIVRSFDKLLKLV